MTTARLTREIRFEAAHRLPLVPPGHKCGRLHGHSYRVRITVEGEVSVTTGMVIDFAVIADIMEKQIRAPLDHYCLNDIDGLENPTSEVLASWIAARLRCTSIDYGALKVVSIIVAETCTSEVEVRP